MSETFPHGSFFHTRHGAFLRSPMGARGGRRRGGSVWVGGYIRALPSLTRKYVYRSLLNGGSWETPAAGSPNSDVWAVCALGDGACVVSGTFSTIGGVTRSRVAKWTGSEWVDFGAFGSGGVPYTLFCDGLGNIIAAGTFLVADGVGVKYVAKRSIADGPWSDWGQAKYGVSMYDVQDLCSDGTYIYSANISTTGNTAFGMRPIDGSTNWDWIKDAYGYQKSPRAPGYCVELYGGYVYCGGGFDKSYDSSLNYYGMARWSAAGGWEVLPGTLLNRDVYDLCIHNGSLYACGTFLTDRDSNTLNRIARWTGSGWEALGSGLNGDGRKMLSTEAGLIVIGPFTTAGGVTANGAAIWDGSAWADFNSGSGAGFVGTPYAIALVK